MKNTSMILAKIEQAIAEQSDFEIEPMRGDVWLWASAMQKAIRRGETERAMSAALSLYEADTARFWRRLHIISVEDVGVGDVDAVIKTLTAYKATAWRKRVGDLLVGLYLVQLLCEAVKCRLADTLYCEAERDKAYNALRLKLSASSDDTLGKFVLDAHRPLAARVLALWYLAGTKRYPSDYLPQRIGSLDNALSAIRALPTPPELTEACAGVLCRTQWPLALITPLIWADIYKNPSSLTVEMDEILVTPDVCGMPAYAADTFTRVGKASIRTFQKSKSCFAPFHVQQIAIAIFYLDGGRINKGLTSTAIQQMLRNGELADAGVTGLSSSAYQDLQEHVCEHWGMFEEIRATMLREYMRRLKP